MSLFEYLAQCSFWQWVGTLLLTLIVTVALTDIIHAIRRK